MTDRNPASKNQAVPSRSSWRSLFGRWFSSPEQELPEATQEPSGAVPESAPPPPAVKRPPAQSIQPLIDPLGGPDSERTVYGRVPSQLLDRARDSHPVSDIPRAHAYEEDDRTMVFAPPADLLRGVWEEESRHETITARPPPDNQPALSAELKPSTPPLSSPEATQQSSTGHASTPSVAALPVAPSQPPSSSPKLTLEEPKVPEFSEPAYDSDIPPEDSARSQLAPSDALSRNEASDDDDDDEDENDSEESPSSEAQPATSSSRSMVLVMCVLAALAAVAYAYLNSAVPS